MTAIWTSEPVALRATDPRSAHVAELRLPARHVHPRVVEAADAARRARAEADALLAEIKDAPRLRAEAEAATLAAYRGTGEVPASNLVDDADSHLRVVKALLQPANNAADAALAAVAPVVDAAALEWAGYIHGRAVDMEARLRAAERAMAEVLAEAAELHGVANLLRGSRKRIVPSTPLTGTANAIAGAVAEVADALIPPPPEDEYEFVDPISQTLRGGLSRLIETGGHGVTELVEREPLSPIDQVLATGRLDGHDDAA